MRRGTLPRPAQGLHVSQTQRPGLAQPGRRLWPLLGQISFLGTCYLVGRLSCRVMAGSGLGQWQEVDLGHGLHCGGDAAPQHSEHWFVVFSHRWSLFIWKQDMLEIQIHSYKNSHTCLFCVK